MRSKNESMSARGITIFLVALLLRRSPRLMNLRTVLGLTLNSRAASLIVSDDFGFGVVWSLIQAKHNTTFIKSQEETAQRERFRTNAITLQCALNLMALNRITLKPLAVCSGWRRVLAVQYAAAIA